MSWIYFNYRVNVQLLVRFLLLISMLVQLMSLFVYLLVQADSDQQSDSVHHPRVLSLYRVLQWVDDPKEEQQRTSERNFCIKTKTKTETETRTEQNRCALKQIIKLSTFCRGCCFRYLTCGRFASNAEKKSNLI